MELLNRHGLTPLQAAIAVKMFADAEGIEPYWGLTKDERQQLGFDLADKFLELPEERQLEFVSAAKSVVIDPWWKQLANEVREFMFHTNERRMLRQILGGNKSRHFVQ